MLIDSLGESERIFADFFKNSGVGLVVYDRQLRYRMVNPYLAASNCAPIESHLGKHIREILGRVSVQVEPAILEVFAKGRPILNREVAGVLARRPHPGHWIDSMFPIADSEGKVKAVGAVVVELPAGLQLQALHEHGPLSTGILRSWKDIARYLGTCVKTVQRWERTSSLPIRRLTQPKRGATVFALQDEVDEWLRTRRGF